MPVPCARCSMPLPGWELERGGAADCPACGARNQAKLFPAAFAQGAAPRAEAALEGEAACFDHPAKRAVAACQHCGRFVCPLCAIETAGGMSCPSCVANPGAKVRTSGGDGGRMLYDTWALLIPFGMLVIWPLTVLSAPAVGALAIMKWKAPISLVRRNRWRFVAGLTIALIQGALWLWFGWYFVAGIKAGFR